MSPLTALIRHPTSPSPGGRRSRMLGIGWLLVALCAGTGLGVGVMLQPSPDEPRAPARSPSTSSTCAPSSAA